MGGPQRQENVVHALAFDRDIGDWAVHSVREMTRMFNGASSFNQDLGWCLDEDD